MLVRSDGTELAPELISPLYSYRWTIETFFKFLKQMLRRRHLSSQRKEGVQIQIYGAMIVRMLMNLWTGIKPIRAVMDILIW